ncbi:MAG: hypothetical protein HUU20_17880 [Pirellulales bacterium]|nr:hypothetical protein [Pirellulales bacterium]
MTTQPLNVSRQEQVRRVLARRRPDRIVYAPNYWQWFSHHLNHGLLTPEASHCRTQLDLIRHLGLDVFSRNIYCDQQRCWFGGLAQEVFDGVEVREEVRSEGRDLVLTKTYATRRGALTERLRYIFAESTLVQEVFALDHLADPLGALEELLQARRWRFLPERYAEEQARVGDDGLVVAGELFSPLKALHFLAGAVNATYLIADHEARVRELLALHEAAALDLARQMAAARVPAMMAMDNLDTAFHTPAYVERFSASFYEKASRIAHEHGSTFFIHACGRQRANLRLIDSLGVDGLEGVAFPPLGDVQLDEAMQLTGDRFLITGGISALETENFRTADEVRRYVEDLCRRLRPYAHRFILAASCNTSIRTPFQTLLWFRDAWREFSGC